MGGGEGGERGGLTKKIFHGRDLNFSHEGTCTCRIIFFTTIS